MWWIVLFPVLQLCLLVVSVNLLGDRLRAALNRKLRQAVTDLLIHNIRPMAGAKTDLLIRDGRSAAIGLNLAADGVAVEDGNGAIAIPARVDADTHLDKTIWGMGWFASRKGGELQALIDNERNARLPLGLDLHRQSMRHAMHLIANGTGHIRSHVDVDHDHKLTLLEGKLRRRETLRGAVDIQTVAFPHSGLMIRPGVDEVLDEALAMGADVVGDWTHRQWTAPRKPHWMQFSGWPKSTANPSTFTCTNTASWGPSRWRKSSPAPARAASTSPSAPIPPPPICC